MPNAFWEGVLAGYGIAIPVGAIAILIVETGLQKGFVSAFAAGAGAAGADLIYASIAAVAGTALAGWLAPAAGALRVASGLVLLGLGAYGLYRLYAASRRQSQTSAPPHSHTPALSHPLRTFTQFLGLTLLNPLTVAYFASLILGMRAGQSNSWATAIAFVVGAALASLSWQSLLAGVGALGHQHLSPRFRAGTSLLGNLIIIAFGLRTLVLVLLS
jgi:threonine/homoserine/homoserine lactone efflux protein